MQPGGIEPPRGVTSTPPGPKPGAFASFATAAVSGDRRRLVAAGLVCRWLPPRVHHSTTEVRAGVEPASQGLRALRLTVRPPHPFSPGQECSTTPGRSYVRALCDNFFHYAILAPTGLIFLIKRLHVTVQTPLSAPSSQTRPPPRHADARWSLGRESQARSLQEAPQTRLAETQRTTRQVVAPLKTNAPRRRLASQAGCRYAGDPERPRLRYDLSRFASSTYFRRTIQKRPLMETV